MFCAFYARTCINNLENAHAFERGLAGLGRKVIRGWRGRGELNVDSNGRVSLNLHQVRMMQVTFESKIHKYMLIFASFLHHHDRKGWIAFPSRACVRASI